MRCLKIISEMLIHLLHYTTLDGSKLEGNLKTKHLKAGFHLPTSLDDTINFVNKKNIKCSKRFNIIVKMRFCHLIIYKLNILPVNINCHVEVYEK